MNDLEDVRLPDAGPPIDHHLLECVARQDPEIPPETIATVFRLIAAYKSWDGAYAKALLSKHKKTHHDAAE